MKTIILDSTGSNLKIHDVTDSTCHYYVYTPIPGIAEVPQRVTQFNRAGEDGVFIANIFQGQRTIHLDGIVAATAGVDDYTTMRQNISSLQQATRNNSGVLQQKTCLFTTDDGNTYAVTGQITNILLPDQFLTNAPFSLDIICNDWFFDYNNQQSLTLQLATGGGFILPVDVPIVFAAGTGNVGTANNAGNVTAYPIITITGIATNPLIVNQTTSQYISFNLTMISTDTLVIDPQNKTVLLNGVSALLYVQDGSSWWGIQPGNNTISYTSGGGGDDAKCVLTYYNTWAGI
jgi:phage-related protein